MNAEVVDPVGFLEELLVLDVPHHTEGTEIAPAVTGSQTGAAVATN